MPFSEVDVIDQIARHERGISGVGYSYPGAQNPGGKPNIPGVLHLSPRFVCRPIAFSNEWNNSAEIISYLLVCPREAYGGKLSSIESAAIPFGERWRNKFQDRNTIAEISRDLPRVLSLELIGAEYRTDIEHDGIIWVGWKFTFNVEHQEIGNMTISPYYNVTDYGAIGDGANDDTAAIQNTINATPANGGLIVFPPGNYLITSPITLKTKTILRGAGQQASVILCSGSSGLTFSGPSSLNDNSLLIQAEDLTVRGDYTSGTVGINVDHVVNLFLHRVCVEKFSSHGVKMNTVISGTISDCMLQKNDGSGLYYGGTVNNVTCIGGTIQYNNGDGVTITADDGISQNSDPKFIGVGISVNRASGLSADYATALTIIGCHYEDNKKVNTGTGRASFSEPAIGYNIAISPNMPSGGVGSVAIYGNRFSDITPTSGTGYHIKLFRANGCTVDGNTFLSGATGYTEAIVNDSASAVKIVVGISNYYEAETRKTSGSGTFNGTTGTTITHQLRAVGNYMVGITPTATMVGRWYIDKATNFQFTVYSTDNSDAGGFDWVILKEAA